MEQTKDTMKAAEAQKLADTTTVPSISDWLYCQVYVAITVAKNNIHATNNDCQEWYLCKKNI